MKSRRYMSTKGYPSPVNSDGMPYQPGNTWHCSACGQSGPDRDDVEFPRCTKEPQVGSHSAVGALTLSCREVSK